MPAPKPIHNVVFVLVPMASEIEAAVRAARKACRVAHYQGLRPMCPLLYYLTFMSQGEISMEHKRLFGQWLANSDRIWLQFPNEEEELLDSASYAILEGNRRRHWNAGRKPVYQLLSAGDDYVPLPMKQDEVRELLMINLTSGLARQCM
jgi:hypothetical protein